MHCRSQQFGTGDLGRRGMAFFFQSYDGSRNPLFRVLGVPLFKLSPAELRRAANAESHPLGRRRAGDNQGVSSGAQNNMRGDDDWGFFASMSARDDLLSLRFASATATRRAQRALLRHRDGASRDTFSGDEARTIAEIQKMMATCDLQAAQALVGILDEDVDKLAPRLNHDFDVASILATYCKDDSCRRKFQRRLNRSDSDVSSSNFSTSAAVESSLFGWAFSWTSKGGYDGHKSANDKQYSVNDGAERVVLPNEGMDEQLRWALAEVHAALAELESEGRFTDWQPDAASALFHTARAAELGSPVAAHALARWHAGLAPGALAPQDALVGQIQQESSKSGPLLVLAARRGDAAAAVHAARGFVDGNLGLPADRRAAERLLRFALHFANANYLTPPQRFSINDLVEVDYRNKCVPLSITIELRSLTHFCFQRLLLRRPRQGCPRRWHSGRVLPGGRRGRAPCRMGTHPRTRC